MYRIQEASRKWLTILWFRFDSSFSVIFLLLLSFFARLYSWYLQTRNLLEGVRKDHHELPVDVFVEDEDLIDDWDASSESNGKDIPDEVEVGLTAVDVDDEEERERVLLLFDVTENGEDFIREVEVEVEEEEEEGISKLLLKSLRKTQWQGNESFQVELQSCKTTWTTLSLSFMSDVIWQGCFSRATWVRSVIEGHVFVNKSSVKELMGCTCASYATLDASHASSIGVAWTLLLNEEYK